MQTCNQFKDGDIVEYQRRPNACWHKAVIKGTRYRKDGVLAYYNVMVDSKMVAATPSQLRKCAII